jgi:hypothetical protein
MVAILAGALVLALPCAAIAQIAILQIRVLEGEGAVHPAGARGSRPLTVAVTDEIGRPVPGAAVSFLMPDEGPGGTFAGGLRTEMAVTGADGRAGVRNLQINRIPGRFEIRVTVAKQQVRAGMVVFQYVAEAPAAVAGAAPRRRWAKFALLAAGAAGGGIAAGMMSASTRQPPALSVGTPTIAVGKP